MASPKRLQARRRFLKGAASAGAVIAAGRKLAAQQTGRIAGFDHVAVPMQNTEAMLAFYRALGCEIRENAAACSVYFGDNMVNFHRPERWQDAAFTLRAPAAKPPCGDFCFVWEGSAEELNGLLRRAQARIVEGPVARQGGRKTSATSVYVRDPDGNLLEFMIY